MKVWFLSVRVSIKERGTRGENPPLFISNTFLPLPLSDPQTQEPAEDHHDEKEKRERERPECHLRPLPIRLSLAAAPLNEAKACRVCHLFSHSKSLVPWMMSVGGEQMLGTEQGKQEGRQMRKGGKGENGQRQKSTCLRGRGTETETETERG
jgi:hypothetical protein